MSTMHMVKLVFFQKRVIWQNISLLTPTIIELLHLNPFHFHPLQSHILSRTTTIWGTLIGNLFVPYQSLCQWRKTVQCFDVSGIKRREEISPPKGENGLSLNTVLLDALQFANTPWQSQPTIHQNKKNWTSHPNLSPLPLSIQYHLHPDTVA